MHEKNVMEQDRILTDNVQGLPLRQPGELVTTGACSARPVFTPCTDKRIGTTNNETGSAKPAVSRDSRPVTRPPGRRAARPSTISSPGRRMHRIIWVLAMLLIRIYMYYKSSRNSKARYRPMPHRARSNASTVRWRPCGRRRRCRVPKSEVVVWGC